MKERDEMKVLTRKNHQKRSEEKKREEEDQQKRILFKHLLNHVRE